MNWGHRGRWSLMLLLLCLLTRSLASQQICPPGDYVSEKGICCNKCSPGFKLVEECHAAGQRSNCTVCPDRQYTDQMNFFPNCKSCIRCKASDNKVEASPCEKHRNAVCRCAYGYYKSAIDSETFDCLRCKKCGSKETETQKCSPENDTQCACKENYYRVTHKCEPCKVCSPECLHFCSTTEPTTKIKDPIAVTEPKTNLLVNTIAACAVSALVLLFLVTIVTYVATKRSTKKKMRNRSSEPRSISPDSQCKVLIVDEEPWSEHMVQAVAQMPESEQESCKLPDCVPLEINIPNLIYTVLDLVPVQQVKQLVRTLGVTDTEIEQAEMDHRCCKEAHYQMLRVWAESGPHGGRGGRGRVIYRAQVEELLDQLRNIHLGRAAEELGTKYGLV